MGNSQKGTREVNSEIKKLKEPQLMELFGL